MVEEKAHEILSVAQHAHVVFLLVGDPFVQYAPASLLFPYSTFVYCFVLTVSVSILNRASNTV